MPDFNWNENQAAPLPDRFPDKSIGLDAWKLLVDTIAQSRPLSDVQCEQALDKFLQRAIAAAASRRECRVFISHRQADVAFAERIAYLASTARYGYWLDVHNPTLKAAGGRADIPSPQKEFLLAAIIEIGLLNASHVIAAITPHSPGSKWIPYELGRATDRLLRPSNSAVWLHPHATDGDYGEYILLGTITKSEGDISTWLSSSKANDCRMLNSSPWGNKSVPAALP